VAFASELFPEILQAVDPLHSTLSTQQALLKVSYDFHIAGQRVVHDAGDYIEGQ
jgi:hypothetical protein